MASIRTALFPVVFVVGFILALSRSTSGFGPVAAAGQPRLNVVTDAGLVPADRSAAADARRQSPAQQGTELVALDFEDSAFPPDGWTLLDNVNNKTGRESRHAWSRQTCEKDGANGGEASAWCSGGGLDGAKTACGENIGLGTEPWLVHPGIDISAYPGGIQVDLMVLFDAPVGQRVFYVCAAEEGSTNFNCAAFSLPSEQLRARWLTLQTPIYLPDTAGLSNVQVAFVFNDKDGAGDYPGVFIDNVKIEGLAEAPATPEVSPTATRRNTPTRTPTRTRFTPTPTLRPTQERPTVYLPMLAKNKDGYEPHWIKVSIGSELGDDNHVINVGKQFQYGTMSLCGEVAWGGFSPSTELRWQWYRRINGVMEEIPSAILNGIVVVGDEPESFVSANCLAAVEEGVPAPLPENDYRLDVFIEPDSAAFASEGASITDEVPPGKTPIGPRPTPGPTGPPSPTPKVTPGGESCQNVDNADFERGPSAGWSLRTNVAAPNDTTERVIRASADVFQDPPAEFGDYVAALGGGLRVEDNLISSEFPLPDASEIVSATLNFTFLIFTEETRNGTNDDTAVAFVMNQDGQAVAVPGTGISEEIVDAGNIYTLREPVDVSSLVMKRDAWTSAQLGFQSTNSEADPTVHVVDNVVFALCTTSLFNLPSGWTRRVPMADFWPLPRQLRYQTVRLDNLRAGPPVQALPRLFR